MEDLNYDSFKTHLHMTGWMHVGGGSFRTVYGRGKWVIKIPYCTDGALDNLMEAKAWRKYKGKPTSLGLLLAPCRLLPNGCLLMASVETHRGIPSWKKDIEGIQVLDKCQAGLYKGRVVAYDFGLDLTERLGWEYELGLSQTFFQNEWAIHRPHLLMEQHGSQDHQRNLGSGQEHVPSGATLE